MALEKSCGAVVFTRQGGEVKYLLIRNPKGVYGFPKGHVEPGEGELKTARREIFEETGLQVQFLPGFRAEDHYVLRELGINRHIVYFLASFQNQQYRFASGEISGGGLYSFDQAQKMLQFAGVRRILREADEYLRAK